MAIFVWKNSPITFIQFLLCTSHIDPFTFTSLNIKRNFKWSQISGLMTWWEEILEVLGTDEYILHGE
jgi:hypothetical protein